MWHVPPQGSVFSFACLALITVASFLIADITVLLVADRLELPALPADGALALKASAPLPPRPRVLLTSVLESGVFGRSADQAGRFSTIGSEGRRLQFEPLNVRLVGTIVSDPPHSFAVLEDLATKEQTLYRLHDRIQGTARIVKIERNKIDIARGRYHETLQISLEEPVAYKPAEPLAGIVPAGAGRLVLDRRELASGFENLANLMTQARVSPHVTNGKPEGFLIRDIVPGSLFARVGLRNNDVLRRINGVEVKDPETLFKIFLALKDETSIALDILRAGQPETYAYEIR